METDKSMHIEGRFIIQWPIIQHHWNNNKYEWISGLFWKINKRFECQTLKDTKLKLNYFLELTGSLIIINLYQEMHKKVDEVF